MARCSDCGCPDAGCAVQPLSRRHFLRGAAAAPLLLPGASALATAFEQRSLSFVHTHTGEKAAVTYFRAGAYDPRGLERLTHLLRDFRTGDAHPMDPQLFDVLFELKAMADREDPFEIISGYRSPMTNDMLRSKSSGVAKRSLHMDGKAIDVRLRGFSTAKLRDLALSAQRGGVGFYHQSDFLHLDTGRVRRW